jgi:hypothetical protein
LTRTILLFIGVLSSSSPTMIATAAAAEPVIVACKFEKLPQMILIFRGGMGAADNTLQIGQTKPVPMSVGSSLMLAEVGAQSFTFSLRLPASVSVSAPGQDTKTYDGDCISSLQPD